MLRMFNCGDCIYEMEILKRGQDSLYNLSNILNVRSQNLPTCGSTHSLKTSCNKILWRIIIEDWIIINNIFHLDSQTGAR